MRRRNVFLMVVTALVVAMLPMTGMALHVDPPSWEEGAEVTLDNITYHSVTFSWPEATAPEQGLNRYRVHLFLVEDDEFPLESDDVALGTLQYT